MYVVGNYYKLPFFSVDTFILQGCTAISNSVDVITVSCNSSHEIRANATCLSDSGCDPLFKIATGNRTLNITGLDGGNMYTVVINVYSNGQVVLMNESVTLPNIMVIDESELQ